MKHKIVAVILGCVLILLMPLALLVTGLALPPQFGQTYYGQFANMYDALYQTEGKKIVVVGNSAVAFGVDSALVERELQGCGLDYKVRNFGLYGALGTKMTVDLSLDGIGEGDVVVFMPELIPQSMSLYFSAEQAWRALDQDKGMISALDSDNRAQLIGTFPKFVAEKYKYALVGGAKGEGVYASSVFDERGDMKNYARTENIMQGAYDPDSTFDFETSLIKADFVSYINDYYAKIYGKGAKMYFYFAPINALSVTETGKNNFDGFVDALTEAFDFPLLGDPTDAVMQAEWFYDANVHLNDAGMTTYSLTLVNALKTRMGSSVPNATQPPEMPALPENKLPDGEGDSSHAKYFLYETEGEGVRVVGLTEEGLEQTSLTLPWTIDGKAVVAMDKTTFRGNALVQEITLQRNIKRIPDDSFDGCTALKKIHLKHTKPTQIGISTDKLLSDTDGACFYVDKDVLPSFVNNYSWSYYAAYLKGE